MILDILLGLGAHVVFEWLRNLLEKWMVNDVKSDQECDNIKQETRNASTQTHAGWISTLFVYISAVLVALLIMTNYSRADHSCNTLAEQWSQMMLDSLPEDAVLFVGGDEIEFIMRYLMVHWSFTAVL